MGSVIDVKLADSIQSRNGGEYRPSSSRGSATTESRDGHPRPPQQQLPTTGPGSRVSSHHSANGSTAPSRHGVHTTSHEHRHRGDAAARATLPSWRRAPVAGARRG